MPLYRGFFKKGPVPPLSEAIEPTRRIIRPDPAAKAPPIAPPVPPPVPSPPVEPAAAKPASDAFSALTSPVVGWLVVIAGPGRGTVLQLGYGINDIGSGAGARIRLNFGDPTIAEDSHAAIIYTTRSRRFYLAQSAAAETWLNDRPVRESVELKGGETLRFGQTQLRFTPFCSPDFDWRDAGARGDDG